MNKFAQGLLACLIASTISTTPSFAANNKAQKIESSSSSSSSSNNSLLAPFGFFYVNDFQILQTNDAVFWNATQSVHTSPIHLTNPNSSSAITLLEKGTYEVIFYVQSGAEGASGGVPFGLTLNGTLIPGSVYDALVTSSGFEEVTGIVIFNVVQAGSTLQLVNLHITSLEITPTDENNLGNAASIYIKKIG